MISIRPLRLACFVLLAVAIVFAGLPGGGAAAPVEAGDLAGRAQHQNLGLAIELIESVFNGRDPAAVERLVSDDIVIETSSGTFVGQDGLLEYVENVRDIYPDAWFQITSLVVAGETVEIGWKLIGTRFVPDTSGRIDIAQLELAGVFTVAVDGGEVASVSAVSEELVVAGPSDDVGALPPEPPLRGEPA